MRVGNIKSMNLSGNKLETVAGFSKLYSLEYLDVSNNQISQVILISLTRIICVLHFEWWPLPYITLKNRVCIYKSRQTGGIISYSFMELNICMFPNVRSV